MPEDNLIKYSFGGGPKKIEGYKNVDIQEYDGVTDVIWDLTLIPYAFTKEGEVDEILAMECLEHLPFKTTLPVLMEWHRILKTGGKLTIQVPDIGRMIEYYVKGQVCKCVPPKAKDWFGYKADPWCVRCNGMAQVSSDRWLRSFVGAQKHPWDIHRNIFTKESLKEYLNKAGFEKVEFKDNIYKLIAVCVK